jgi:hypothetical protein
MSKRMSRTRSYFLGKYQGVDTIDYFDTYYQYLREVKKQPINQSKIIQWLIYNLAQSKNKQGLTIEQMKQELNDQQKN